MGRMARRLPPPSSGAIIFYGRAGSAKYSSVKATSPSPSTSTTSSTLANPESDATDSDGTPLNSQSQISFKAVLGVPDAVKSSPDPLANGLITNGKTVFRLAQELTDAFSDVPYVKVVVSLVQQILDISDVCPSSRFLGKMIQVPLQMRAGSSSQQRQGPGTYQQSCDIWSSDF